MSKTVAIHQPNFLPWLGYFHKLIHSDVFVMFDDVQYTRGRSFGNRILIKTPNGASWITVPVSGKGDLLNFNEILIGDNGWSRKVLKSIQINYSKAPFFNDLFPSLKEIMSDEHKKLFELNKSLLLWSAKLLNAKAEILSSEEICGGKHIETGDKILFILEQLQATKYISGTGSGSIRYLDEDEMKKHGIEVIWQYFKHPEYTQLYGPFEKNLSIIDLLFNCGPERSRDMLMKISFDA